jgi:hypothetical protein
MSFGILIKHYEYILRSIAFPVNVTIDKQLLVNP